MGVPAVLKSDQYLRLYVSKSIGSWWLITLIGLSNLFDQYYILEDPEKIFTRDIMMVSSKNVHFWRFRGFYKHNYLQ